MAFGDAIPSTVAMVYVICLRRSRIVERVFIQKCDILA